MWKPFMIYVLQFLIVDKIIMRHFNHQSHFRLIIK